MSYGERLILALRHPVPETRYRAARILGMRQEAKAVNALVQAAHEANE